MDKKTKDKLTVFLTDILKKVKKFNFKVVNFNDNDINFLITPNAEDELADLHFILYVTDIKTITIYCPLLYKLKSNDSIMYMLNTINNINGKLPLGKIYISSNNTYISYVNRIILNNIFHDISSDLLKDYFNAFIICGLEFYLQMKEEYGND